MHLVHPMTRSILLQPLLLPFRPPTSWQRRCGAACGKETLQYPHLPLFPLSSHTEHCSFIHFVHARGLQVLKVHMSRTCNFCKSHRCWWAKCDTTQSNMQSGSTLTRWLKSCLKIEAHAIRVCLWQRWVPSHPSAACIPERLSNGVCSSLSASTWLHACMCVVLHFRYVFCSLCKR